MPGSEKQKENSASSSTSPSIKVPSITRILARTPCPYLLSFRSFSSSHFGSAGFGGGCFWLYSFINIFVVGVLIVVGVTFSLPVSVLQREEEKQKISWQHSSTFPPALLDVISCQQGQAMMQIHAVKPFSFFCSSASVTPSPRAGLWAALATAVI